MQNTFFVFFAVHNNNKENLHMRQSLVRLGFLSVLLLGGGGMAANAVAAEAARVVFVTGEVDVASKAAQVDTAVQEGDQITTGPQGYVYMKTVDGGFLILRPNSKARIVTYHVDPAQPANTRVKFELLSGVARSISGQGVKQSRQNFRFNTPVAAIGVRGTDFIVFTDQQTSRIAVVAGGVTVSGFAGACGREGSGPCEGGRELFAGQPGMLLQVERGQNVPTLLNSPSASPDQARPPRADEPAEKSAAAMVMPPAGVNLEAQKDVLVEIVKAVAKPVVPVVPVTPVAPPVVVVPPPPPVVTVPVVPPVPVVPVLPPAPTGPEVAWGRWEAVAGRPVDSDALGKLGNGTYNDGHVLGSYAIRRLENSAFVMPGEGIANFALVDGEATLQRTGDNALPAEIRNANLAINFATRTFDTNLLVVSADAQMQVRVKGNVFANGELWNQNLADVRLRGYLGGAKADEAAYIFRTMSSSDMMAEGVTRWER